MPHFDYASSVFIDLTSTQISSLQTLHNACIRFIHSNIPFIPTQDITSRLTHRRLELGWLSLTSRRHLLLACLFHEIFTSKLPVYLLDGIRSREFNNTSSRPIRTLPRSFDYKAPRTEAWANSFCITGQSLMNKLGITGFSPELTNTFKTQLYKLLLKLETDEWLKKATFLNYTPLHAITSLPSLS